MATRPPTDRIASLDVIRGVAVMGILVANLPAFALPDAAYFSPLAWGGTTRADVAVWFATFVLVEGKLRGLFAFLFGASMLLVIDRAEQTGGDGAAVHFRRMATLFLIGCVHLYLFWWGDILSHYALVGALAYMFVRLPVRWLVGVAVVLIGLQTIEGALGAAQLFASAPRATPEQVATWNRFAEAFGQPAPASLTPEIAAYRGGFGDGVAWRWDRMSPFAALPAVGLETLSAMLLGMAAFRSGFLGGAWPRQRYRRWMIVCLGTTMPIYVALALNTLAHQFDQRWVYIASIVATEPVRPIAVVGYAATILLAMRPGGRLTRLVAATGRAAFTNYLGTTLLMTFIFAGWGLGQFAHWSRAMLYFLVPVAWAAMLLWSKPWLDRFAYGPLEWLWRSLARLEPQPLRRVDDGQ